MCLSQVDMHYQSKHQISSTKFFVSPRLLFYVNTVRTQIIMKHIHAHIILLDGNVPNIVVHFFAVALPLLPRSPKEYVLPMGLRAGGIC